MDSCPRSSRRHSRQQYSDVRRVADLIQQIEHFDQEAEYDLCYTENSHRLRRESRGLLVDAHPDLRESIIQDHSVVQSSRVNALRALRRNSSDRITQNQSGRPFSSDMKRAYSKTRILNNPQKCQVMNTRGDRSCSREQSRAKFRNGKKISEKASKDIQGGGVEAGNCFSGSACTPAKLSRGGLSFSGKLVPEISFRNVQYQERNGFSGNSTPQTSSHDLPCRERNDFSGNSTPRTSSHDVPSRERTEFSNTPISQTSSHDVPSRGRIKHSGCSSSQMHLESKKSKRSLRKFSCMSSADALPTLVSMTGSRNTLQQKKNENVQDSRQIGSSFTRSTGCIANRISHSGFLIPETKSLSSMERLVSPTELSFLTNSNDVSVRQNAMIIYGSMVPRVDMSPACTEIQESHNELGDKRNSNLPIFSSNASENTSQISVIEDAGRFHKIQGRDMVGNIEQMIVSEQRTGVDSTVSTSGYGSSCVCSNIIDPSSATCRSGSIASNSSYERISLNEEEGKFSKIQSRDKIRNIREMVAAEQRTGVDSMPSASSKSSNVIDASSSSTCRGEPIVSASLYDHIQNHTGPNDDISSPSSCMSSSDVHHPSDSRSFNSRDLRQILSSQYYQLGYHGRSGRAARYCPFRRFPLRDYDENDEYCTFGGSSEVLSSRGYVERDDTYYEQAFMLEANLLLGGISSYDRHRDLRLDIDNMSYEDLLLLEERIGFVSTGLEKDMISKCVQSEKYCTSRNAAPYLVSDGVEIKCSICQEDFEECVELGLLKCGHKYHLTCIEQWLQRKNECPICKLTALS